MSSIPRGAVVLVCLLGLAVARPAIAEEARSFALTNVRIVPVVGTPIDRGTVVVVDGLIRDVGAAVQVPPGVARIDGGGRTVYPGLFDALGQVGLPAAAETPARGANAPASTSATPARGPEDRPASTPWEEAADALRVDDARIATWRSGGFTTVMAAAGAGLLPGQGSVINLAGARHGDMVVKTPAAVLMTFKAAGGFGSFPGSLMGAIAYLKQVHLDAGHAAAQRAAYARGAKGRVRVPHDRTARALHEATTARRPALLPASTATELARAVRLGRELGVATVVYGAHEAYGSIPLLEAARVPVLVSAKWPEAPRDRAPDADDPLAVLRLRDRAPTTPAALAAAGIPFAFYSDGLATPKEMLASVRRAVGAGLSREAALRALTLGAAEIYEVDDRLGSIEPGKIANLVVATGDLFDEQTRVTLVAVDGALFDIPAPEADEKSAKAGAASTEQRASASVRGAVASADIQRGQVAETENSPDPYFLIRNVTVLTVTSGTIEDGAVLVRDGKIAAVGRDLAAPAGAKVVDGQGMFLMPGIIDAHSHIAIDGSVNEGSVSVSSMVAVEDVLDPDDEAIYRALAGGVTTVHTMHGSANAIGGTNAVIKLRWGADAEGLLFRGAPPTIKFALGENPKRAGSLPGAGAAPRYPATRMGVVDVIRQAFVEAQAYKRAWDRHRSQVAAGDATAVAPRKDLKLEPLVEILEGKRFVHAHCYRADEILQLIRIAEEFGFRIGTFQHVLEGYKVADEIARHGAGASTFSDWWAYKVEAYDAIPYNAALMAERGIVVSINSDSAEEMRHLNQEAAKMVKYGGMSDEEALKLVTINPARQLHVDDRVGSIEVGKDADLVLFDRHPLSVYAVAQKVFVDGRLYFDRARDLSARAGVEAEKKALAEKLAPRREARPPDAAPPPHVTRTPTLPREGGLQ